jgi:hypothetical protein
MLHHPKVTLHAINTTVVYSKVSSTHVSALQAITRLANNVKEYVHSYTEIEMEMVPEL